MEYDMKYNLEPRYDTRRSFYGKATVIMDGNTIKLKSYDTIVATIITDGNLTQYNYYGHYSATTTRHQKEFFKQQGLCDKEIKELFKNGILVKEGV